MNEKIYMLNFKTSGVKNLEEEICLEFYNKTIENSFNPEKYRIKAIYGENGSGKTAIVVAVDIMKNLIIDSNYLGDSKNQRFLQAIANKVKNEIYLSCDYLYINDDVRRIYTYEIILGLNEIGFFEITKELLTLKINSTRAKSLTIFECFQGEIQQIGMVNDDIKERISRFTQNLLSRQSFAIGCLLNSKEIFGEELHHPFRMVLFDLFFFAARLFVFVPNEADPELYLQKKALLELEDKDKFMDSVFGIVSSIGRYSNENERTVSKTKYNDYEQKIKKMECFIQLFKGNLSSIDVEKTEVGENYICKLLMNYGDYKIDTAIESTGIARLIRLYDYLNAAAEGDIAFIDEMDANINDVYLCKIVEYFMEYGKGQLCFTTHNTSPMSVLKKNKKSIDFLSIDYRIVSWKTNGNFAPDKLYKQGLIEYLPFNTEPEDFVGILGE